MFQNYQFQAQGRQIAALCTFIRYEAETSGAVNAAVRVRADGQDLGEWLPGDSAELPAAVSIVEIAPLAGAVGTFRTGVGKINVSRVSLSGQVGATIVAQSNTVATMTNTARTVTNASAQVLAATPARKYLLIQNKDATGAIWVCFGAGPATQANGIRIGPGGFWEWDSTISTQAVQIIGDIASNANVLTVEGV